MNRYPQLIFLALLLVVLTSFLGNRASSQQVTDETSFSYSIGPITRAGTFTTLAAVPTASNPSFPVLLAPEPQTAVSDTTLLRQAIRTVQLSWRSIKLLFR